MRDCNPILPRVKDPLLKPVLVSPMLLDQSFPWLVAHSPPPQKLLLTNQLHITMPEKCMHAKCQWFKSSQSHQSPASRNWYNSSWGWWRKGKPRFNADPHHPQVFPQGNIPSRCFYVMTANPFPFNYTREINNSFTLVPSSYFKLFFTNSMQKIRKYETRKNNTAKLNKTGKQTLL